MVVKPQMVLNPVNRLKGLLVLIDGTKNAHMSYSVACFEWDGLPVLGFRWDGGRENRKNNPYKSGFPYMDGCNTWMILPKEFYPVIAALIDDPGTIKEDYADYFFFRHLKNQNEKRANL